MPRPALLLSVAGALVGLVFAVLLYRSYGNPDVQFGPRGFAVSSDSVVQVTFDVVKDPASTAYCTVRSRDRYGVEVGSAVVRVGPSPERRQVITYDLATNARANTGEITACTLGATP